MPASIFNGVISFGLVSVPITVLSATEDHSVRFRRIHTADNALVRNRYWCEQEDREVTFGEIGRGYELPDGRVIPFREGQCRRQGCPRWGVFDWSGGQQAAVRERTDRREIQRPPCLFPFDHQPTPRDPLRTRVRVHPGQQQDALPGAGHQGPRPTACLQGQGDPL